jgi:hypothetical protein
MNKRYSWIFASFLAISVSATCAEEEEKNFSDVVFVSPVSASNLNFNSQGNIITARSGEKVFSTLNFSCEHTLPDPDALYQIVIGYEGIGPQKCVFNELGYRFAGKEGILSFFFEAPEEAGVYNVQCQILSARSSVEALQNWWNQAEEGMNQKTILGKIVVK